MRTTITFSVFCGEKDHYTVFMLAFLCVEREGFFKGNVAPRKLSFE